MCVFFKSLFISTDVSFVFFIDFGGQLSKFSWIGEKGEGGLALFCQLLAIIDLLHISLVNLFLIKEVSVKFFFFFF